jgi:hypothetical protein
VRVFLVGFWAGRIPLKKRPVPVASVTMEGDPLITEYPLVLLDHTGRRRCSLFVPGIV